MSTVGELLYLNEIDWLKQCDAETLAKQYPLSRPFCYAVTEEYLNSNCRIMIVGQEALDFGPYTSEWPLKDIYQFNVDYVSTQLGYKKICRYNRSPFWNLFRIIKSRGIEPSWNNIDKFHRINEVNKTIPLTEEIEEKVDVSYGCDHKSILRREIEIAKPNVILFVIGPDYHKALSYSLDVEDERILEYRPYKNDPCLELPNTLIKTDIPMFWSYHPAYLNRIHSLELVVNHVNERVKNLIDQVDIN